MTETDKWRVMARVLVVTVPLGGLIGIGLGWLIAASGRGMAAGAMIGVLIAAGIISFDVSWTLGLIPRRWREAPFLVVMITRSLVWLAVIVLGISLPQLIVAGVPFAEMVDSQYVVMVALTFVVTLLFNFVGQVNRLLGRRVLVRLILGRYHRPREEVRVFLLIDLRESTQIAERLGNLRYHAFLKRFIGDVTGSVVRYQGEVYRYVGDQVILTWIADEGLRDARCVQAVFAISDSLEAGRREYEAEFGMAPSFWAGLHVGPVVAGEVGTIKHEIAFLGDTVNTAARIEQATKDLQRPLLASADVVSALDLPDNISTESLGRFELRGVEESVELFAMTRAADRQTIA